MKNSKITLHNLSHDGRGVGQLEGKTVFVAGALPDETVSFNYKKRRANFDEGEVETIFEPSPLRVEPKCEHFGLCGGCSLQHLDPKQQIQFKQSILAELLKHQANAEPKHWLEPMTAATWGYRNKARLGVKFVPGKDKVLVGFREKNSRYLANLNHCEVLHPSVGKKLLAIGDVLYQLDARDKIAQIEVAIDDKDTALILRHLVALSTEDLEKIKQLGQIHNFKIYLQPKGIDSVSLFYPENGQELMQYQLPDFNLTLQFHPMQFTQVNQNINQQLIHQSIKLLQPNHDDKVLDLFCGIGNFTLPLATQVQKIVGVEGAEDAIVRAKENATLNKISNTEFYCENLFEPPFQTIWSQQHYDKILLDPPRSGAQQVIPYLDVWQPSRLVYISCNPSTLARDTKSILEKGYTLQYAGVADMFAHTQHVESIALFVKE